MDHILSELFTMTHHSCMALHSMAHSFIELNEMYAPCDPLWPMWSVWLVFWDCGFILSALWWMGIRGLCKLPGGREWLSGNWVFWQSPAQFSSVPQSCPTLCDPMDCSIPGFPVHHQLPEFIQTHVYWVSDAIQPSHPLSSPSSPAFNLSQRQGLFQWVSSLNQVNKVLEFQLQLLSVLPIQDWFSLGWTGWTFLQSKGLSRVFSNTTVQKHQFFGAQLSL